MWEIEIAVEAAKDLHWFRKKDQTLIGERIETQLRHQPDEVTRNRKRLRPGHRGEWELRIGNIRVFYDLDLEASVVRITGVGLKERKKLFFRGQEYLT
jgi:mRNA-degrading endonuclease RelE of RelBE toxin-antitoxin system